VPRASTRLRGKSNTAVHDAMICAYLDLASAEIAALGQRLRPQRQRRSAWLWVEGLSEVHRMHRLTRLFPAMALLARSRPGLTQNALAESYRPI
jgi:hypothetical protein